MPKPPRAFTTFIWATALLLIAACHSPHRNSADAGADTPEVPPPSGECTGLSHTSPLQALIDFESIECVSTEPTLACVSTGLKRRDYTGCALIDPDALRDCLSREGPCDCGPDGVACTPNTFADERPCTVEVPQTPIPNSPWGPCDPQPPDNTCALEGQRTRSVVVCSTEMLPEGISDCEGEAFFPGVGSATPCTETEPCQRQTEGTLINTAPNPCTFPDDCATAGVGDVQTICTGGVPEEQALSCTRASLDGALINPRRDCETACEPLYDACCDFSLICLDDDPDSCASGCEQAAAQPLQHDTCSGETLVDTGPCDSALDLEGCANTTTCVFDACTLAPSRSSGDDLQAFSASAQIGTSDSPQDLSLAPVLDAETPAALCRGRVVFGDLTLDLVHSGEAQATVALPHLQEVHGRLIIQGSGNVLVTFPSLEHIGNLEITHTGSLVLQTDSTITPFEGQLPPDILIEATEGRITLQGEPISARHLKVDGLDSVNLANLATLTGDLMIRNTAGLTAQIEQVEGDLRVRGDEMRLDLGALQAIGGSAVFRGVDLDALALNSLETIGDIDSPPFTPEGVEACAVSCVDINISDLCPETENEDTSDIDGDGFGDACDGDRDGDLVANAFDDDPNDPDSVTRREAPDEDETRIRGDLRITSCGGERFEFPALRTLQGHLRVLNNDALVAFDFSSLSAIGGGVDIRLNNALRTFSIPALESVGAGFRASSMFTSTCGLFNYVSVIQSRRGITGCVGVCGTPDTISTTVTPLEGDEDADFIVNACDNCPSDQNTDQQDSDGDKCGDVCDEHPNEANPLNCGD